jgi:hypothetical protein
LRADQMAHQNERRSQDHQRNAVMFPIVETTVGCNEAFNAHFSISVGNIRELRMIGTQSVDDPFGFITKPEKGSKFLLQMLSRFCDFVPLWDTPAISTPDRVTGSLRSKNIRK